MTAEEKVSYWPGEVFDGKHAWAVDSGGKQVRSIPHDVPCRHCGEKTWRLELGAADRHWDGGYVCSTCATARAKRWIGLVSPDGKTELNARFALGDEWAESLTVGQLVTLKDRTGKERKWRVSA